MRTQEEIREEIAAISEYRKKWPCSRDIMHECDIMIRMLKWVLKEEE